MVGEKVDFEEARAEAEGGAEDRKNERSSIEFPYMPLDTAVEVAQAVYNRSGYGTCEIDELAAEMGQTISGAFRQKTAAAKTFGVVDKDGRSAFKLTELGKRVVANVTDTAARVDAFLSVPLYSAVYDKYRGQRLPPAKALEREMAALGVSSKQTDRARQAFERSAHYAGFFASGEDRLVKPKREGAVGDPATATPAVMQEPVNRPPAYGGGGGDGRPPLDPIIQGLIDRLPPAGSKWPQHKRKLWLDILENSFNLVYEEEANQPSVTLSE